MKALSLCILTPDGEKYRGTAESILVRCEGGDVEIYQGHEDFFAPVKVGSRVRVRDAEGKVRFASASGGFLSVKHGEATLLTNTFEYADEIDLARAENAKARAEAALASPQDERAQRILEAKLKRALCRISIANER